MGEPLSGIYAESYWVSRLEFPTEAGFSKALMVTIEHIVKAQETIRDMKLSGGKVEIYLQLSGSINNGDTIPSELLTTMGEMGIDLLLEVFVGV